MLPVIIISFFATLVNLLPVLIGAFKTPLGASYLWTGHYYADYFYYLQIMAQGKWGSWQVKNYFATDDPTVTLLGWWPDLILGKIAGLFRMSPVLFYWLAIAVFSIVLCLLIYLIIEKMLVGRSYRLKLAAFILTIFAGPFPGFGFWSAPSTIFERLGGVNRHLIDQIIALVIVLLVERTIDKKQLPKEFEILNFKFEMKRFEFLKFKNWEYFLKFIKNCKLQIVNLVASILLATLLTFSPQLAVLTFVSVFVTTVFYLKSKSIMPLITFTVPFVIFYLLVKRYSPDFGIIARGTAWNVTQQVQTTPLVFIGTMGPLFLAAILGIKKYLKALTPVRLIFSVFLFFSLTLFFSPVPQWFSTTNIRFLVSLIYIPLGVLGSLGILEISNFIPKYKKVVFAFIFALCTMLFALSNKEIMKQRLVDPNLNNKLSYLSADYQEGIKILGGQTGTGNVLTGPYSDLGIVLPVFVNRKMYFGMSLITPNYELKWVESANLFNGVLKPDEATDFLAKNNLEYVVWTNWDGGRTLLGKYIFLKPIYLSQTMVVYRVTSN